MNLESLSVPEGAVILIRDEDGEYSQNDAFGELEHELHKRFPHSLVVLTSSEFSTMDLEELEFLLRGLMEHKRALV
jgi:hypothetical protein